MTHLLLIALITLITLALPPAAFADPVVGSGGANGWKQWTKADLNENGTPYWDGKSYDGKKKNIGYCLTNSGNCGMSAPWPGNLDYWGGTGGVADSSFYLNRSSSSGDKVGLKIEIAGNASTNKFGWYDTENQAGWNSPSHVIFDGPASAGAATVYIPTLHYGFWFTGDQGTYFTQSSYNILKVKGAGKRQQFAIFKETADAYWLGMEDRHSGADYDYNDMVVKISSAPDGGATLVLLGGVLVGLETLRRKLRV